MFDCTIEYRKGKKNGNADALSRMVDASELNQTEMDPNPITINAINIQNNLINADQLMDTDIKWLYDLKRSFKKEAPTLNSIRSDLNKERRSLFAQWNRIRISGKNLYREYNDNEGNIKFQYIVPKNQRLAILNAAHDHIYSGHLGHDKTVNRIIPKFYWPNSFKEIAAHVKSCISCQEIKTPNRYNEAPLQPIRPRKPGQVWTSDIMGPIKTTANGYSYILVICDHFSKWVEIYALKTISALEVSKCITNSICQHGIPEQILTDQGSNYMSELMAEVWELLDIHKTRTTPFHPECDGLSEKFNQTLRKMISAYVNESHSNWDENLNILAFAYNTSVHGSTGCTPFEITYGYKPKVPLDLMISEIELDLQLTPGEYAANLQATFDTAYKHVASNRDLKMDRAKINHDRQIRAANFEIHDQVKLINTTFDKTQTKKFKKKWVGPYKIVAKWETTT